MSNHPLIQFATQPQLKTARGDHEFKVGDGVTVYIDGGAVLVGTSFDLRGTTGAQIIGAGQNIGRRVAQVQIRCWQDDIARTVAVARARSLRRHSSGRPCPRAA